MNTSIKLLCALSAMSVFSVTTAHADNLYGLYADADYWFTSSKVKENGVKTDFDDQGQIMLSASLEHGLPFIPNVRARYTTLDTERSIASTKYTFDVNNIDAILYYEILDNVVSVDVGLGAKILSGDSASSASSVKRDIDESMGLAYVSAGGNLPFTGLSAKAELAYGFGSDVTATDAQAEVKYKFIDNVAMDLGVKAGYRVVNLDFDKLDGVKTDSQVDFSGPYLGMELHF